MVIGRVNKDKIGLINVLIKPRTIATSIAVPKLFKEIPGRTHAATKIATELIRSVINKLITNLEYQRGENNSRIIMIHKQPMCDHFQI